MIRLWDTDIAWCADAVADQIRTGRIGCGAVVEEFERKICEVHRVKHCIATTSGTTALLLSLMALDLPASSTVAFPAYGMLAGANAARLLGLNVRLIDVEPYVGMMTGNSPATTLDGCAGCIYINNNTARCSDWGDSAMHSCKDRAIPIIEDACQTFGIMTSGIRGDLATFSFSPQKLATTGQGGAVITNDEFLASRVRELVDHGGDWRGDRIHKRIGGNFRFNDVSARLGLCQLNALPSLLARRQEIRRQYREFLPAIDERDGWCVTYRCERAAELVTFLAAKHIEAGMPYPPNYRHAPYRCRGSFPGADAHYNSTVYLPSHLKMTKETVSLVCEAILEFEAAGKMVSA